MLGGEHQAEQLAPGHRARQQGFADRKGAELIPPCTRLDAHCAQHISIRYHQIVQSLRHSDSIACRKMQNVCMCCVYLNLEFIECVECIECIECICVS